MHKARLMLGGGTQAMVRMAGLASAAITTPLLARHLGSASYGRFVIALTIGMVVATVADMGLPLVAARDWPRLAEAERQKWLSAFWSLRLWSAVIVTVGSLVVVAALSLDSEITTAVTVGLLAVPVTLVSSALASLFFAKLDPWPSVWSEVASRVIWVVGVVAAIAIDASMIAILGILIGSQAVGAMTMVLPALRQRLLAKPQLQRHALPLARVAAPLAVLPLLGMIYARADTLVMAALVSDAETGIYGAMWRLVEVIVSMAIIGSSLLLPLLSSTSDVGEQKRYYVRATRLLMMILIPIAAVVAVMASPVLAFFGGPEFFVPVEAGWGVVTPAATLVVLMGGLVLMGFGIIHGSVMVATHRQHYLLRQSVMVVGVNLALAWYLIPRWSFFGAAVAVLVTEVLSIVHSTWVVRGALGRFSFREVLLWPCAIAAPAVAAMLLLGGAPVLVQGTVGLVVAGVVAARSPLRHEVTTMLEARSKVSA